MAALEHINYVHQLIARNREKMSKGAHGCVTPNNQEL